MIVEGQVHGGVAQGVGGALYERMAYDESGQLLNASFMDFLIPYASEVPHIETDHLETPSPLNPLGLKGAGEAGTIPASAPSSPRRSRTPRGSRSARCRSARSSSGSCASSTRRPPTPFPRRKVRDEDLRKLHARGAGRQGVGGDPRPGRARPLHPRLRDAQRRRRGPLRHVGDRRRRGDQGHVRRRGVPRRPGRAPLAHDEGVRGRRPRHDRRRRQGAASPPPPAAAPSSPTTPTPRSVAPSAASASACSPA